MRLARLAAWVMARAAVVTAAEARAAAVREGAVMEAEEMVEVA